MKLNFKTIWRMRILEGLEFFPRSISMLCLEIHSIWNLFELWAMSKIILKFNNTNVGLKKLYLFEKNTYGDFDQGFGKRRDFYFPNRYFDLVCLHARSYSTNSFKRQLFLYFKKFAKKTISSRKVCVTFSLTPDAKGL